jgi:hypothetical protein
MSELASKRERDTQDDDNEAKRRAGADDQAPRPADTRGMLGMLTAEDQSFVEALCADEDSLLARHMISQEIRNRIKTIFTDLDKDGNQTLEESDFMIGTGKMKEKMKALWDTIVAVMDVDGDRQISLVEFTKYFVLSALMRNGEIIPGYPLGSQYVLWKKALETNIQAFISGFENATA